MGLVTLTPTPKTSPFLVSARGLTLAPPYDLISVAVYGRAYDYMAMTIAGEARYGWVEPTQWTHFAKTIGVPPSFIQRLRRELGQSLPKLAREVFK